MGEESIERLNDAHVAIFGIGGVGGYVAEALARSGVGTFDLVDRDEVDITNLNRQIIALDSTVGRAKVSVMAERIKDINPNASVNPRQCFFLPENSDEFDFSRYDYVIDAVDTVTAKLAIITKAIAEGVPVISSMGAGNRLDPARFRVSDIYSTSICPLARVMRRELKKREVRALKCVWSDEEPVKTVASREHGRNAPASIAFAPASAGLLIAAEVVKDLSHPTLLISENGIK